MLGWEQLNPGVVSEDFNNSLRHPWRTPWQSTPHQSVRSEEAFWMKGKTPLRTSRKSFSLYLALRYIMTYSI